jgi:hypothetical protein
VASSMVERKTGAWPLCQLHEVEMGLGDGTESWKGRKQPRKILDQLETTAWGGGVACVGPQLIEQNQACAHYLGEVAAWEKESGIGMGMRRADRRRNAM